ncbi:DUF2804 domain-containing protein [Humibacillus xanthopallidus]|uniref:Uncharacterized protein DUF2804 n=1 Tax=Humibacillus xanthopallidus TaxID=412689 RepID=A0A543I2M0_9MICO|nr:DUF2804 domain-containing protein [Humibacillus xanthopallidus]TQM64848.1 uncharacterized protein DUF2804 [Humibacillus xanthopallidus]
MPSEREITEPVDLTLPDGRLNPAAIGWTRTPLHRTDGIGRGRVGWGRNKRWEYWAVALETHVVAVVVSDIGYAAVPSLFVLDRRSGEQIAVDAIAPLGRGTTLPGTLDGGPANAQTQSLRVDIDPAPGGTRLRARAERVELDVVAQLPPGHERLGVVVPWSDRLFQYTVKDPARPAVGRLSVDGTAYAIEEGTAWATLDHGRGRWPYAISWNWGSGSGVVGDRVTGLQVGGRWTQGTGVTENAVVVDGALTKISDELRWGYSSDDWLAPWRIQGGSVELTFHPEHVRRSVTQLGVIASRTHQCFGTWAGRVGDVAVDGIFGWAEDVHQRW